MVVGIVGLGLIGGSLAKAFKFSESVTVLATDINPTTTQIALMSDFIDGDLSERISECDCIFLAIDAPFVVKYIKENASKFKKDSIVIDCCGVKGVICQPCFDVAQKHDFHFIGGHPMAGLHKSGLKYSKEDLFKGANMVLVPMHDEDINVLQRAKDVVMLAGFGSISITTPQKHDEIIAFTSQLAHVVSNAYVKSPNAPKHKGFSAGSYKDLTRVAWLNENMWAQLFLSNKQNICFEIENLISELTKYNEAIKNDDKETLVSLLKDGRECKERCDKFDENN